MLRAIRRAKLVAIPGNPPLIATSNGNTSTVSAPPTPAPNAASVVRSMFTQGSRCVIIGNDVSACTTAAPLSGSPTPSATRREADLPQRPCHRNPAVGEHPQVGHRGGDAAGELPGRVGAEIVKRRP